MHFPLLHAAYDSRKGGDIQVTRGQYAESSAVCEPIDTGIDYGSRAQRGGHSHLVAYQGKKEMDGRGWASQLMARQLAQEPMAGQDEDLLTSPLIAGTGDVGVAWRRWTVAGT